MVNPRISEVDLIYPNQLIKLPPIEKKNLMIKDAKGAYYIHYASFYNFNSARELYQTMQQEQRGVFLHTAQHGRKLIYRIYLGAYPHRDEAQTVLDTTHFEYLPFLNTIPDPTNTGR